MSLLDRINRVLHGKPAHEQQSGWQFGIAALLVPAIVALNFPSQSTVAQEAAKQSAGSYSPTPASVVPPTIAKHPVKVTGVEVALASFDAAARELRED